MLLHVHVCSWTTFFEINYSSYMKVTIIWSNETVGMASHPGGRLDWTSLFSPHHSSTLTLLSTANAASCALTSWLPIQSTWCRWNGYLPRGILGLIGGTLDYSVSLMCHFGLLCLTRVWVCYVYVCICMCRVCVHVFVGIVCTCKLMCVECVCVHVW